MATARLGAHVNGGITGALEHARRIGLAAGHGPPSPIQLWSRNPTAWRSTAHASKDMVAFREGCAALGIGPVFVHGIYLMNFASADDVLWERSIEALVDQLQAGAQIGAAAVILHPGSAGSQEPAAALDRCAAALRRALALTEHVPDRPLIALETCAGSGRTLGRTFDEIAGILERVDRHPAVAVALDTAHLWGSGYDLATTEGLDGVVGALLAALPRERLVAIHANDSKVPLGSHKDRHENIGQGTIGEAAFARLLAHPLLRPLPWIMEVPGFDGNGPDTANLQILRRLAAGTA